MSHLGERVTALVDGQMPMESTERALMHVAGCPECRDAVELERLMKQRLASLRPPEPGLMLMGRLLDLAGPAGPLPPRPGHVPGSPSPRPETFVGRPPGRRGSSRPALARPKEAERTVRSSGRAARNRMAAAVVGAACLVSAGVAGGIANGAVAHDRVVPPVDSFVLEHQATTGTLPFGDQTVVFQDQSVRWGAVGAGR
jgi:Putative zinc-finger